MRTATIQVYKFEELSQKAKDAARAEFMSWGYSWQKEAFDSLKELIARFGAKLDNWQIDYFACSHSSIKIDADACEYEEDELRAIIDGLGSYNPETLKGLGDCVLTGYCMDEAAIDGVRAAYFAGVRSVDKLLQAGFDSWLKSCQADCESQFTDEYLKDHCEANEYEFTESGELFTRGAI